MTILNYALDNGLLFFGIVAVNAGLMGYSLTSSYFNKSNIDKGVQTDAWEDYSNSPSQVIEVSESSSQNITPNFSPVSQIDAGAQVDLGLVEAGTQTSITSASTETTILMIPNPEIMDTISKTIKTIKTFKDAEVQVKPILSVDTINVNPSLLKTPSIFRNVDLSEVGQSSLSVSSKSVQIMPELKNVGSQTILSGLYQEDNIINPDLKISADLLEFGTGNVAKELVNNSVQTSIQMVNKGVQTRPDMKDMKINLSEFKDKITYDWKEDPNWEIWGDLAAFESCPDVDLIEAYEVVPGIFIQGDELSLLLGHALG